MRSCTTVNLMMHHNGINKTPPQDILQGVDVPDLPLPPFRPHQMRELSAKLTEGVKRQASLSRLILVRTIYMITPSVIC